MLSKLANPFSDRALDKLSVDLSSRKEGLTHATRLLGVNDSATPINDFFNTAMNFYLESVAVEQGGSQFLAIPQRLCYEDTVEGSEIKKIRFEFSAGTPAFLSKYCGDSKESVMSVTFKIADRQKETVREIARRVGATQPQQLVLRALDRLEVYLEYRHGAGLFTQEAHLVGTLDGVRFDPLEVEGPRKER